MTLNTPHSGVPVLWLDVIQSCLLNVIKAESLPALEYKHVTLETYTQSNTEVHLDPQTSGGELLVVALIETILPHQRCEMLQTVGVALRGRDVEQVVSILVSDQLQIISCQVRLHKEDKEEKTEVVKCKGRRGDEEKDDKI